MKLFAAVEDLIEDSPPKNQNYKSKNENVYENFSIYIKSLKAGNLENSGQCWKLKFSGLIIISMVGVFCYFVTLPP